MTETLAWAIGGIYTFLLVLGFMVAHLFDCQKEHFKDLSKDVGDIDWAVEDTRSFIRGLPYEVRTVEVPAKIPEGSIVVNKKELERAYVTSKYLAEALNAGLRMPMALAAEPARQLEKLLKGGCNSN